MITWKFVKNETFHSCHFDAGNIWYNSLGSKRKIINLAVIGSRKMEKEKNEKIIQLTNEYIDFIKRKSDENKSSTYSIFAPL